MAKGWDYESAHRSASQIEHACRLNKKLLNKKLAEEVNRHNGYSD